MTSEERRLLRYQRRKAKRLEKKQKRYPEADNFEKVFEMKNLRKAFRLCRQGVMWKSDPQRYLLRYPIYTAKTQRKILSGTYRWQKLYEFNLFERGVMRHISANKFTDRVPQRCYCESSLVPLVTRGFIYDNGACQKGKGYHWAVSRMEAHLHRFYRKHGRNGWIWLFDFSKFFDNVSHKVIHMILQKAYDDERLIRFGEDAVAVYGDKGLGLGSPINHVLALASADKLDHYIKEMLRVKYYARYMDDGYIICESKEKLLEMIEGIKKVCRQLGIRLNDKKTRIVKLTKGFSWLKVRWYLTPTGKVVKKIYKKSVTRMRRKIKKFPGLIKCGIFDIEHANISVQSWLGYAKHFDCWHSLREINKLWEDIFGNPIPPSKKSDREAGKKLADVVKNTGMLRRIITDGEMNQETYRYAVVSWKREMKRIRRKYDLQNLHNEWEEAQNMVALLEIV